MKTADGKLITTRITVKIFEDIDDGVGFVALVQTVNENKVMVIADL